ncbi:MAG TPA: BACON domain-containing carbohydrate-binding protein [Pyrinomonadaceae bacterium]|nr:BACON domain-containing carbohydrate-binding protein [Pyrinomonadaceae bacterium]
MIKVIASLLASLLGVAALFPTTNLAQKDTERPARTRRGAPVQDLNRLFKNYERMRLDTAEAARQVRLTGRLWINTERQSLELELEPHDLRAEGYMAEETVAGGARLPVMSDGAVRTFKGRVRGNKDAQARFTIDEDSFEGSILTPQERYYVEPARRYLRSAGPTEFLFYRASDVIETEPVTCGIPSLHERISEATDQLGEVDSVSSAAQEAESFTTKALAIPLEAELATEADFEYVTALGGTVNANNEILSIMNQVEGVYQTQIGLSFKIVFQHTWATSADPYTTVDPVLALKEFTNYWNANFSGVVRDLAHMWTGKNLTNTAGVGWTGVVCGSPANAYSLSERVAAAPQKYVLPAHEIGHNFNATHTDGNAACANTIMQSVSTNTSVISFCQFSRDQITAFINANSTCLSRAPVCTYSIAPTSASLPATGGTGSITVTATAGCTWTAASNVTWITITQGASGTGNGMVSYSVAANTATTSRTGTITVAGKTFTVTQAAATPACTFTISPASASLPSTGGTGSVTVTTTAGCAWTARSNVTWITVTQGASGTGNGTVSYSVAANTATTSRSGTVTIAGRTFTVTQAGAPPPCAYTISPTSASFSSASGTGSITVTTTANCAWTAKSNVTWITITAGASRSGNGTVSYTVAANTATVSRTGTITVAGKTFTVTQAAAPCNYSISPTSASYPSSGGASRITVTTTTGCAWTARSNVTWITITAGASGSGAGTVSYSVAANTATTSRTGTITVAGKTFTVTQAAAPPPGPALSSLTLNPTLVAGCKGVTGTVRISAPAPANGTVVTLSDTLASTTLPSSVIIPAGATSKTFTITTVPVSTSQTGTVTAKLGTVTKSATLTVRPIGVLAVAVSPNPIIGGNTATGRVSLECVAGPGNITVTLTDNIAATTLPASITVPAGASSQTFQITTAAVTTTQSGTLTATANGIGKSVAVTVRPIGIFSLTLSPNPAQSGSDVTGTVTLERAAGPGNIVVSLSSSNPAIAALNVSSITIPAGSKTGTFTVHTAEGSSNNSVVITASANGTSKSVTLVINGQAMEE